MEENQGRRDDELRYYIAATQLRGIGPKRLRELIAAIGSVNMLFTEPLNSLHQQYKATHVIANDVQRQEALRRAEKELAFIEKENITALSIMDTQYPYRLKQCDDAPIVLYVRGVPRFNDGKFLGIVGTRKITPYGKGLCERFVSELKEMVGDITVVSGLAYGVDVTAHRAALQSGITTMGVVGHGLDTMYPATHREVAKQMIQAGGAVVTEYLSESLIDAAFFVQRNRIIAGLSDALLVVESAQRGGALLTAKAAFSYDRDVFAFPGRVNDMYSAGCNGLIKSNAAQLVESAAELCRCMRWDVDKAKGVQQTLFADLNEEEQRVIELLHASKLHIDEMSRLMKLTIPKTLALLLQMEFKGLIQALPGGMFELSG